MLEIQTDSMPIDGQLLSRLTLDLLSLDAAECVSFETADGFHVKVMPAEQDMGTCPDELQTLIQMARSHNKDWLYISHVPAEFDCQYQYRQ